MEEVSTLRLYLLRAMYALIAVGLGLSLLPGVVASSGLAADSYTVIDALLLGFAFMALWGIRYPLLMLPVLLLELFWKTFWLLVFALPLYLDNALDEYAIDVVFACMLGVVLTPLVIPWGYVWRQYVVAPGQRWA